MFLRLLYRFKDVLIQSFVVNRAVVTLDIGVLLGLAGLDVLDVDAHPLCPYHQLAADIFWAVINPNNQRFPAPLDDPFQAAHHPLSG